MTLFKIGQGASERRRTRATCAPAVPPADGLSPAARSRSRGRATARVFCTKCGQAVPYTGAFTFVVCPSCKAQVHIARAAPAPDEADSPFPSAAATERVVEGQLHSTRAFGLPTAAEINLVGHPMPSDDPLIVRGARLVTSGATALLFFMVLNNVAFLLAGAPVAADFAASTTQETVVLFLITPTPVAILGLSGAAAVAWHIGLVAVIVASCALFIRQHWVGAFQGFAASLLGPGSPRLDEPNGYYLMARLFSFSMFVTIATYLVANAVGATPRVSDLGELPVGYQLMALANASVWEEVVTRMLLLGVPLLLVYVASGTKLEQPAWRYLVGGKLPLDAPAVAFLIFSAVAFGLAHVGGWDWWKFPGTFAGGLAMGVLYLRIGIHAAIVCHFVIDYFGAAGLLGATAGYNFLLELAFDAFLLVGAVQFIRYFYVVREVLAARGVPPHLGGPAPQANAPAREVPAQDA